MLEEIAAWGVVFVFFGLLVLIGKLVSDTVDYIRNNWGRRGR